MPRGVLIPLGNLVMRWASGCPHLQGTPYHKLPPKPSTHKPRPSIGPSGPRTEQLMQACGLPGHQRSPHPPVCAPHGPNGLPRLGARGWSHTLEALATSEAQPAALTAAPRPQPGGPSCDHLVNCLAFQVGTEAREGKELAVGHTAH